MECDAAKLQDMDTTHLKNAGIGIDLRSKGMDTTREVRDSKEITWDTTHEVRGMDTTWK